MLKKDLTSSYPRSPREKLLGVVQLARAIDKGIAFANGTNGEYNYDCPLDRELFGFLGLDGQALLGTIKTAQSEDEILAVVKPYVDKKSPVEIDQFNAEFLADAPAPGSDGEKYFIALREAAAPGRSDVTTWVDVLDLDEKRDVPIRTAA